MAYGRFQATTIGGRQGGHERPQGYLETTQLEATLKTIEKSTEMGVGDENMQNEGRDDQNHKNLEKSQIQSQLWGLDDPQREKEKNSMFNKIWVQKRIR